MYASALILHSIWRWFVLAAGAATVITAVMALPREAPSTARLPQIARIFGVAVDIQVLLGASLYLLFSPLTTVVPSTTPIKLPSGSQPHYFNVVHPLVMLGAFIAVHLSAVLAKRTPEGRGRARRAALAYGLTFIILLAGIPWWRPWWRPWGS